MTHSPDSGRREEMSEIKDGGPAFPSEPRRFVMGASGPEPVPHHHPGMSLRDWFAGQALAGILAGEPPVKSDDPCLSSAEAALGAYRCADAMLAASLPSDQGGAE